MALPADTWAQIKAEFETGNFSVEQLAKKYLISPATVKKRLYAEKWVKGRLKPLAEAKAAQTMVEKFAAIGLTPEKVMRVIQEGIEAEKTIIVGSGDQAMADQIPDWQARDKFTAHYYKLTGGYEAEKIKSENININTTVNLSALSDDELEAMEKLLDKARSNTVH